MGKDLLSVIENINEKSSDISQFCFEQIYSELLIESKQIICTLCLYEDAVSKGILKYISNLQDEIFEDSIKALMLFSLIIPVQMLNKENQEINSFFSLLPLTRGYVKAQLDKDVDMKMQIQKRMMSVDSTLEDAERAKGQYRYSLADLGAITEEEKVAAMLAQVAYQKYQSGSYASAVESYKKAVDIAPRLASIYRNWAIMESMEMHWVEADKLIEKASRLWPNNTQIWLVWGNMKRKQNKIREAHQYYCKAYELSPKDAFVLNSYAQTFSRLGEHRRANELLEEALTLSDDTPHNKHLIVNYTSIAENYKKWAESMIKDRDYIGAETMILKATENITIAIGLDSQDNKSNDLLRNIMFDLCLIKSLRGKYVESETCLLTLIKLPHQRYREIEFNTRANLALVELYIKQNMIEKAKTYITKELEKNIKYISKSDIFEKYSAVQSSLLENGIN
jgi:tetratricopeptide (TPR) repeat protein